jgi:hypothetical protein
VAGELPELGEAAQRFAVAHDDEMPGLRVLRCARPARDVEHVIEHAVGNGTVGEAADDPQRSHEARELVRHQNLIFTV